jgi:hypothetical protein
MTGLGAMIYIGFFAFAALWLFMTGRAEGQGQVPDLSNSMSADAAPDGSSPWLVTHSSSK